VRHARYVSRAEEFLLLIQGRMSTLNNFFYRNDLSKRAPENLREKML